MEDVLTPSSDGVQAAFAVTIASEGPAAWVERSVALPGSNEGFVRSIDVTFHIRVPEESRALVERVHGFFDKACWLSQTVVGSRCRVSSVLHFEEAS
jgi:organic hydroperoxide reductase OsmC/OhrA